MSFDIHFVPSRYVGDWGAAIDAMEQSAEDDTPLSDADLATWTRLQNAVESELPGAEESASESFRVLTYEPIGLQLSMSVGEVGISVAYWSAGDEAARTITKVRRVAASVEQVTGLVAYDPQSDRRFLDSEIEMSVVHFDRARSVLAEYEANEPSEEPKRHWWQFWRN